MRSHGSCKRTGTKKAAARKTFLVRMNVCYWYQEMQKELDKFKELQLSAQIRM